MEYINRIKEERSAYVQTVRYSTDSEFLIEQNPSRTDTINELISIMVEPETTFYKLARRLMNAFSSYFGA